uniref:Uncharacterized protein n=1 Tax=Heterorhabditis bacteriophora TaxID=37862 RepID=A0A1I7X246_HETBA
MLSRSHPSSILLFPEATDPITAIIHMDYYVANEPSLCAKLDAVTGVGLQLACSPYISQSLYQCN